MPETPNPADYDRSVFINCPFDEAYLPVFRALVFAVFGCGLLPRCSQEIYDAGQVRIEKITGLIKSCRWGIHDISRTDLNVRGLPRFNMPFELGLFLGAKLFGSPRQRRKSSLVLDRDSYRYQEYLSDIAGQDITAHGNDPARAIKAVRDWLVVSKAGEQRLAGPAAISGRYDRFAQELPGICIDAKVNLDELTFVEYSDIVVTWLRSELDQSAASDAY